MESIQLGRELITTAGQFLQLFTKDLQGNRAALNTEMVESNRFGRVIVPELVKYPSGARRPSRLGLNAAGLSKTSDNTVSNRATAGTVTLF